MTPTPKREGRMLKIGECVLTECEGQFFAVGFLAADEGTPISARCCDVGHFNESDIDACWSLRCSRFHGHSDLAGVEP